MAYNNILADRIREQIQHLEGVEEKEMFGGMSFLLKEKMFVGVIKEDMICRIDPGLYEEVIEKQGCHEMLFTGKPMKGWIMIDESGMKKEDEINYWIGLALDYNQHSKAYKKKKTAK
jgi:TfoX/Sxy family transcriptional regulator of competence genes